MEIDSEKWVSCPRCQGRGEINLYRNIAGGKCFECGGRGVVINTKLPVIKKNMEMYEKKRKEKKEAAITEMKRKDDLKAEKIKLFASNFNNKVIELVIMPSLKMDSVGMKKFLNRDDFDRALIVAKHLNVVNAEQFLDVIKDYSKALIRHDFIFVLERYLREKYNYHEYLREKLDYSDYYLFYGRIYDYYELSDEVRETIGKLHEKYYSEYYKIN